MITREKQNLAAALRLAEAGIPVFPARVFYDEKSKSWRKRPSISDWQNSASTDPAAIKAWWTQFPDALPAIELGCPNLVVIDVDRHDGPDGVANFGQLIDGHDLPVGPVTNTAGGGQHYIFRQPEGGDPLGNGRGDLTDGIDVRGKGGFIIGPGAVRPDGAIYAPADNSPDLADAFKANTIPTLPVFLEKTIRTKRASPSATKTPNAGQPLAPTTREKTYARSVLERCANELENAKIGARNTLLNSLSYRMARIAAAGWIDRDSVANRFHQAAKKCGLLADDGAGSVAETLLSGWHAGFQHPHPPLANTVRNNTEVRNGISVTWPGSKDFLAVNWLVNAMIPQGSYGLIVGESQAGKTFVALHLACALAVGKPFFGKKIKSAGGTAYVCGEGEFSIPERLSAEFSGSINPYLKTQGEKGQNLNLSDLPIAVLGNIPNLADDDNLDQLIGTILASASEMQEKHGVPLRLVIVDTMLAGIGIEDLNSAPQVQKAMNVLNKIGHATGAEVIGVHHHGKERSRGPAGSYAFTAAADFIISVHRNADENGATSRRWISINKSRAGEAGWTCDFNLSSIVVRVDEEGNDVSCAFVEPHIETAAAKNAVEVSAALHEGQGLTALRKALVDSFKTGDGVEFEDGKFRATSKSLLRLRFDDTYGGKTGDAKRKAFNRALKVLTDDSAILIKSKDGEDWVCDPTAVKECDKGVNTVLG